MKPTLGQPVLKSKAILSYDGKGQSVLSLGMEKDGTWIEFQKSFAARVRAARKATGHTQTVLAEKIGTTQGHYKHWEIDRIMPQEFILKFCRVCDVSPDYLYGWKRVRKPRGRLKKDAAA